VAASRNAAWKNDGRVKKQKQMAEKERNEYEPDISGV
jgi:hypothetical protein